MLQTTSGFERSLRAGGIFSCRRATIVERRRQNGSGKEPPQRVAATPVMHHDPAMPYLRRKGFAVPDETRRFANGKLDVISLGEVAIGRFLLQPGWRWSKDVAAIAGTRSCQHRHLGYTIGGSLRVRMDDGTETVI